MGTFAENAELVERVAMTTALNFTLKDFEGIALHSINDDVFYALYDAIHKERSRRLNLKKTVQNRFFKLKNKGHSIESKHRLKELEAVLAMDWSECFAGLDQERKYYVYAHVFDGKSIGSVCNMDFGGIPFYIGKGTGGRAFDLKRNEGHGKELKSLLSCGKNAANIVRLLKSELTEAEAYELESKLIYFFGTRFDGSPGGCLVNLDVPRKPTHVM
jgi:hypothetical protein